VAALREGGQLVQVFGEPGRRLWQMDKAVLDHRGLRMHALGYQSLARMRRQSRQFVGEILRVTDAQDLHAGIVPEAPRRKGDRGQVRLQVAWRQVDDQPQQAGRSSSRR
jgi:hypothetical protein